MAIEELTEDEEVVEEIAEPKKTEVIRISLETKKKLDSMKAHPSMSYDAVIFAYVSGADIDWNEARNKENKNHGT